MKDKVIQAGQTMHEARAKQALAQAKLDEANAKLDEVLERSKTGRIAKELVAVATEERKAENKNAKTQETRFKNMLLDYAHQRLAEDPEDNLKDLHYATTATPITVYEVGKNKDEILAFVAYLIHNDLEHLIQFDGKVEVEVGEETKSISMDKWLGMKAANFDLPPGVKETVSARLTISGYEKWDEKQSNVIPDTDELSAIRGFLTQTE